MRWAKASLRGGFLLVEPNNTGKLADDLAVHLAAARDLADKAIGGFVARELALPLLVPVFPRPEKEWELYTHQLDRDTLLVAAGPLQRLDLQLLAMIDDARARLASRGMNLPAKVLLTGFSASGSFVNRFTALHPERVQAAAAGGLNGNLILPLATLGGRELALPARRRRSRGRDREGVRRRGLEGGAAVPLHGRARRQ